MWEVNSWGGCIADEGLPVWFDVGFLLGFSLGLSLGLSVGVLEEGVHLPSLAGVESGLCSSPGIVSPEEDPCSGA